MKQQYIWLGAGALALWYVSRDRSPRSPVPANWDGNGDGTPDIWGDPMGWLSYTVNEAPQRMWDHVPEVPFPTPYTILRNINDRIGDWADGGGVSAEDAWRNRDLDDDTPAGLNGGAPWGTI